MIGTKLLNSSKKITRNKLILSELIKSTGCRGVPQVGHSLLYNYEDKKHRITHVFSPDKSQVKLLLYNGKILDTIQEECMKKTLMWEDFFVGVDYYENISWEYNDSIGLPRGLIFNNNSNTLTNFDNHIDLDYYFKLYCM